MFGPMFILQSPEQEPENPQYVHNIKRQLDTRASDSCKSEGSPECEDIVKQTRRDSKCYAWSITLLKDHCISFNTAKCILNDIVKLCSREQHICCGHSI